MRPKHGLDRRQHATVPMYFPGIARRLMLAFAAATITAAATDFTERLKVGGEWCFIKSPETNARPGEAVILIHGNGELVVEWSSSWEQAEGNKLLMTTLLDAGYLLAQSNHAAIPGNGMWGNEDTQESILDLMDYLAANHAVNKFHAVAVSAGNATLLNLILERRADFESVVLVVPVLSLESMYRCPAGVNRVAGVSTAFAFQPAGQCPGNPDTDMAFRRATEAWDPLRRLRAMGVEQRRKALAGVRWATLYHEDDPKVIPAENILALAEMFEEAGSPLLKIVSPLETHSPGPLFSEHAERVVEFFKKGSEAER